MKLIRWIVVNAIFAACVYMWVVKGVGGAENVATAYVWIVFVLSLTLMTDAGIEHIGTAKPSVPSPVNMTVDVLIAVAIIWSGAIATGIALIISSLIGSSSRALAEDRKNGAGDGKR